MTRAADQEARRLSPAGQLLVGLLTVYRKFVSPMLGARCRFYPSCSAYALESVQLHGALKGSWLATRRLSRCHPFHAGGIDPVPGSVFERDWAEQNRPGEKRTDQQAKAGQKSAGRKTAGRNTRELAGG
jgi:putative membrane protein insertion efficiency factor